MLQLVIPCQHEIDAVGGHKEEVPDHHALTLEDIATLLKNAKTTTDPVHQTIKLRLCRGILGYTCPPAIKGPVAEKEKEISELFDKFSGRGADPELVDQLYNLMR